MPKSTNRRMTLTRKQHIDTNQSLADEVRREKGKENAKSKTAPSCNHSFIRSLYLSSLPLLTNRTYLSATSIAVASSNVKMKTAVVPTPIRNRRTLKKRQLLLHRLRLRRLHA